MDLSAIQRRDRRQREHLRSWLSGHEVCWYPVHRSYKTHEDEWIALQAYNPHVFCPR